MQPSLSPPVRRKLTNHPFSKTECIGLPKSLLCMQRPVQFGPFTQYIVLSTIDNLCLFFLSIHYKVLHKKCSKSSSNLCRNLKPSDFDAIFRVLEALNGHFFLAMTYIPSLGNISVFVHFHQNTAANLQIWQKKKHEKTSELCLSSLKYLTFATLTRPKYGWLPKQPLLKLLKQRENRLSTDFVKF